MSAVHRLFLRLAVHLDQRVEAHRVRLAYEQLQERGR